MFNSTRLERVAKISVFVVIILFGLLVMYLMVKTYDEYTENEQEHKQKINRLYEERQDIELINAYLGYKDGESKIVKLKDNLYLVTSEGEQIEVNIDNSKVTVLE